MSCGWRAASNGSRPDGGPKPAGGGALLDFGSHLIDQALVLLGPVNSVYAEWNIGDNGLDDDAFVVLMYATGARSHHWGSWRQPAPGPRFRVAGTEAAYVVDGPMDGQEASLVAGDTPRSLGDQWGVEPPARWGRLVQGDNDDVEVVPSTPGAWPTFYRAFAAGYAATANRPCPPPTRWLPPASSMPRCERDDGEHHLPRVTRRERRRPPRPCANLRQLPGLFPVG